MPGCTVLFFDIHKQIKKELDVWVKESKKFNNSSLAALKAYENVGYLTMDGKKHNSYQCSISPHLIDQSFWLAWILRWTTKYWGAGKVNRAFSLRIWEVQFDGYDIWTNFSYKGDDNHTHNHAGFLSGVIYYKNHTHPTIFDQYKVSYEGKDGTMEMFPSNTFHHVKPQQQNKERITFVFNIVNESLKTNNVCAT